MELNDNLVRDGVMREICDYFKIKIFIDCYVKIVYYKCYVLN